MDLPIWLSIGLIVYYVIFQLFSDMQRHGMRVDIKNRIIEKLRSEHKVTIRIFKTDNKILHGFCWFNSIWLNQRLLKYKKRTMFAFYHELYHLKHKHKHWTLFFRLIIALTPLSLYFVKWYIFLAIILTVAYGTEKIREVFETKANEYAEKNTSR